ncbi:MAG: glycosyltransferase family 4 protein [Halarcobacter ebronensis]|uniref:glycosyltransferase family 4 protein n=1 Tax=Halarcobacter ebronensis TaxID=1462615 RepID=UPI003C72C003
MKLYIVSLKRFFIKDGTVHTYGGFGEYVKMFLDDFDEIHLCVPLSLKEIEGGYKMEHPKIHYHFLPNYKNELWLMIKSPLIFVYLLFYLPKADVINPRIPDMTGVFGWLVGKLFRKPMFVSVQSDITLLLENENSTKLKGIMKKGLFAWLRFYLFFEKMIMKDSLAFPQGQRLVEKYSKINPKAIAWVSTALFDKDIVLREVDTSLKTKDKIVLLNVGRLTRAKNQITLIESLNILHIKGYKNIYLKIVGKMDENIYNELKEGVKKYKLEKYVEFIPPVNHGRELWEIFDSTDMFVFSSIWEGTPKVLLEALGRSLPIVSTNVGGIPTVIKDSYNGLLCDKNDSTAFASNIEKFINMKQEELNTFIKNGHDEVSKYTISAQKKVLIDSLYKYGILKR